MSRLDFIQATATSIASSGSGAVTMSDLTGLPGFTDAFGSNPRNVDYVIIDTTNNYYEKGYGVVSAMVLTRSNVHETWNGTTFSTANTAFAFSASPSAGQIKVYLAPTADAFIPAPSAIQTTYGSDTYKGFQLSAHINTDNGGSSGDALSTSKEYYVPYLNIIRGQVGGIGFHISTAGTTGIKSALYEVGPNGMPGNCITQFNAIPDTSTVWATDTTPATWAVNAGPLKLSPGWFYVGFMVNDSAVALKYFSPSFAQQAYPPLGRISAYGFGQYAYKTAQNSYATGMPTGTPTTGGGDYTIKDGAVTPLFTPILGLKIGN